jgi:hypothetical protein
VCNFHTRLTHHLILEVGLVEAVRFLQCPRSDGHRELGGHYSVGGRANALI